MADPFGEKREAIEILLARGWDDNRIAAAVPCSRTWVVGVRKELSLEPRRVLPLRDRIEQAIARGLDDAMIAAQLATEAGRVAKVRAEMDAAADEVDPDEAARLERRRESLRAATARHHAKRRAARLAAKLCIDCPVAAPQPAAPDGIRCETHRAAMRVIRARYLDRQEAA